MGKVGDGFDVTDDKVHQQTLLRPLTAIYRKTAMQHILTTNMNSNAYSFTVRNHLDSQFMHTPFIIDA